MNLYEKFKGKNLFITIAYGPNSEVRKCQIISQFDNFIEIQTNENHTLFINTTYIIKIVVESREL